MRLSAPFITRPVATTLITIGIALAGALAFLDLPVAPLPQVDFPTIVVSAQCPAPARKRGDQRRRSARAAARPDRRM